MWSTVKSDQCLTEQIEFGFLIKMEASTWVAALDQVSGFVALKS